jgi:hypothetical protein
MSHIASSQIPEVRKSQWLVPFAAAVVSAFSLVTPYMAIATASYLLLVRGFFASRGDRRTHGMFMAAGVLTDLVLVLTLEAQRHAIDTAVSLSLNAWQQAHVVCSTMATVLYVPLLITGVMMFRNPNLRARFGRFHAPVGTAAFVFRTLGFFLMFSMLGRVNG